MTTLTVETSDLLAGQIRAVTPDLCIARVESDVVAFRRRCPHAGADLANGYVDAGTIRCAWHNTPFSARTGRSPCASLAPITLCPATRVAEETYEIALAP